jgi:hypothetical protein
MAPHLAFLGLVFVEEVLRSVAGPFASLSFFEAFFIFFSAAATLVMILGRFVRVLISAAEMR